MRDAIMRKSKLWKVTLIIFLAGFLTTCENLPTDANEEVADITTTQNWFRHSDREISDFGSRRSGTQSWDSDRRTTRYRDDGYHYQWSFQDLYNRINNPSLVAIAQLPEGLEEDGSFIATGQAITAAAGGKVGGPQTANCYINIPPNTLRENLFITLGIYIDSDGIPVFDIQAVSPGDFIPAEHLEPILFQPFRTAQLIVDKDLLAGSPDFIVNYDFGFERYFNIKETEEFWIVELPHFSRYSWGWLE